MVLDRGLAVERRVDPGKMRRIEVVLDRELPVRAHVETELAVGRRRVQALLVAGAPEPLEALRERPDPGLEGLRVAREVDEHEIQPDRASHLPKTVRGAVEPARLVHTEPADAGRSHETPFEVVGPAMVGAPDRALHSAGLPDELVAAMRAHVVEHAYRPGGRADHEERDVDESNRAEIARPRHVRRVSEAGPRGGEDPFALEPEEFRARVGTVGEPGRLPDGPLDRGAELGDRKVCGHRRSRRSGRLVPAGARIEYNVRPSPIFESRASDGRTSARR